MRRRPYFSHDNAVYGFSGLKEEVMAAFDDLKSKTSRTNDLKFLWLHEGWRVHEGPRRHQRDTPTDETRVIAAPINQIHV